MEVAGRSPCGAGPDRRGTGGRGSDCHGVPIGSGSRARWCCYAPFGDCRHDLEYRRPGDRTADRRVAGPLRTARAYAALRRSSGRSRCRSACRSMLARGTSGGPSPPEVSPAAAEGTGAGARSVHHSGHRGVPVLRRLRIICRAGGNLLGGPASPPVPGADGVRDLFGLRRRGRRTDHDHQLAGASASRCRDRADHSRAVRVGRFGVDISSEPGAVSDGRRSGGRRRWRNLSGEPQRCRLHVHRGRSRRCSGDVLYRRLRRALVAGRRSGSRASVPES